MRKYTIILYFHEGTAVSTIPLAKGLWPWPVDFLHVLKLQKHHSLCDDPHFTMGFDQLLHHVSIWALLNCSMNGVNVTYMCETFCVHVWVCVKEWVNYTVFLLPSAPGQDRVLPFSVYIYLNPWFNNICLCVHACSICLWPCCETGDPTHQVCAWDTHTFPCKHPHALTHALTHTCTRSGWPQTEVYRC